MDCINLQVFLWMDLWVTTSDHSLFSSPSSSIYLSSFLHCISLPIQYLQTRYIHATDTKARDCLLIPGPTYRTDLVSHRSRCILHIAAFPAVYLVRNDQQESLDIWAEYLPRWAKGASWSQRQWTVTPKRRWVWCTSKQWLINNMPYNAPIRSTIRCCPRSCRGNYLNDWC